MPEKRGRIRSLVGMSEMKNTVGLAKAVVAEALGTLILVYFGCASCISVPPLRTASATPDIVLIALTFGFAILVLVQALGHVSGCNINPAVTLGLLAAGRMSIIRAVLYIIAQCLGAIAGAAILKGVTPDDHVGALGTTTLAPTVTIAQALGIEFMLGFILLLVIFGVIDPNRPECKIPAALSIGLAISVGHLGCVDYTGSSMNPARSLGPAVMIGIWENHWVYWVGPILGGIVASLLYTYVLSAPPPEYTPVSGDATTEMKRLNIKSDENTA